MVLPPPTPPPARPAAGKPGTKLFVGGIPDENATPDQVRALFALNGAAPLEVVLLPPKGSNPDTRCGFVRVPEELADSVCQALNGLAVEGRITPLVVRPADKQGPAPAGSFGEPGGGPPAAADPGRGAARGAICPPPRPAAVHRADPATEKRKALADGRWLEAAEWREQEFVLAHEAQDRKLQRLTACLHAAVAARHYYEAAAISEAIAEVDPEAAAVVNASIAAGGQPRARSPHVATVPPPRVKVARRPPPPPLPVTVGGHPPPLPVTAGGYPSAEPTGDYIGQIISFEASRQYGFIQCAELGADAFVSDKQIGPFGVGDMVRFQVRYSPKGKPQAQNLAPVEEDPASPSQDGLTA